MTDHTPGPLRPEQVQAIRPDDVEWAYERVARIAQQMRDTADRIEAHAHGHSVVEWAVASLREFADDLQAALAVAPKEEPR